jgi:hypothetical protein
MANQTCDNCALRAKYDNNPKSLAGRFWRWHINFCPGWKKYFTGLSPEQKARLAEQYNFKKYQ